MHQVKLILTLVVITLASGCASLPPAHDYSAFREANPHSILVLPPINNTPEIIAPYSFISQITAPIAESGYYVFPVAVVDQTFKSNGLTVASDAHAVPIQKLHQIFGADSALYVTIEQYGTNYVVIASDTTVGVSATLVDLRTGTTLWQGRASASSSEHRNNEGGGIIGMLVEAAVNQIVETTADTGFDLSAITANRLLSSERHNGLPHGPRSPKYVQPITSEKNKSK
ncbi:DUF799 domain-containing protein [Psychrobium sp. 1_MG-2023]|uniref:DUF799 domain-containing protein n=1 Tax=Psychrobium sp. 1_MG-2023 TaxID=3062624 RepID=UPI000C34A147|nr:DUF799 domain-containing protein [Psychrobium sp. 1_MG-2023]MDP2561590.1 DUF799 domain-containing protein [Psychrobium sp. 1_MG-2023]PKF55611.1 hypothetical protein CW748_12175 [Alteromonadales bacterium alter-6D02]